MIAFSPNKTVIIGLEILAKWIFELELVWSGFVEFEDSAEYKRNYYHFHMKKEREKRERERERERRKEKKSIY